MRSDVVRLNVLRDLLRSLDAYKLGAILHPTFLAPLDCLMNIFISERK